MQRWARNCASPLRQTQSAWCSGSFFHSRPISPCNRSVCVFRYRSQRGKVLSLSLSHSSVHELEAPAKDSCREASARAPVPAATRAHPPSHATACSLAHSSAPAVGKSAHRSRHHRHHHHHFWCDERIKRRSMNTLPTLTQRSRTLGSIPRRSLADSCGKCSSATPVNSHIRLHTSTRTRGNGRRCTAPTHKHRDMSNALFREMRKRCGRE
jgi:hypothetical protein